MFRRLWNKLQIKHMELSLTFFFIGKPLKHKKDKKLLGCWLVPILIQIRQPKIYIYICIINLFYTSTLSPNTDMFSYMLSIKLAQCTIVLSARQRYTILGASCMWNAQKGTMYQHWNWKQCITCNNLSMVYGWSLLRKTT